MFTLVLLSELSSCERWRSVSAGILHAFSTVRDSPAAALPMFGQRRGINEKYKNDSILVFAALKANFVFSPVRCRPLYKLQNILIATQWNFVDLSRRKFKKTFKLRAKTIILCRKMFINLLPTQHNGNEWIFAIWKKNEFNDNNEFCIYRCTTSQHLSIVVNYY